LIDYAVDRYGEPQVTDEDGNICGWFDNDIEVFFMQKPGKPAVLRVMSLSLAPRYFIPSFRMKRLPCEVGGFANLKWGDSPDKLGDGFVLKDKLETEMGVFEGYESLNLQKHEIFGIEFDIQKVELAFLGSGLTVAAIFFPSDMPDENLTACFKEKLGNPIFIKDDGSEYVWADDFLMVSLVLREGNSKHKKVAFMKAPIVK
jgi:hypothetical protein